MPPKLRASGSMESGYESRDSLVDRCTIQGLTLKRSAVAISGLAGSGHCCPRLCRRWRAILGAILSDGPAQY